MMKLKYYSLIESKLLSKNIPSNVVHCLLTEFVKATEGNTFQLSYELRKKLGDLQIYGDIYNLLNNKTDLKVESQNSDGTWKKEH